MGQYVERFQAEQPNVKVQLEYQHPDRVYEKILEGTADLSTAVGTECPLSGTQAQPGLWSLCEADIQSSA